MDFDLTEEQRLIRDTARDFAAREIAPKAAELDKSGPLADRDREASMGELGFLGVAIPQEHGGAGMDTVSYALAMEEISAACASCGVIMSVNNSLFCDPLSQVRHRRAEEARARARAPAARSSAASASPSR